jgi:hypothetical protein
MEPRGASGTVTAPDPGPRIDPRERALADVREFLDRTEGLKLAEQLLPEGKLKDFAERVMAKRVMADSVEASRPAVLAELALGNGQERRFAYLATLSPEQKRRLARLATLGLLDTVLDPALGPALDCAKIHGHVPHDFVDPLGDASLSPRAQLDLLLQFDQVPVPPGVVAARQREAVRRAVQPVMQPAEDTIAKLAAIGTPAARKLAVGLSRFVREATQAPRRPGRAGRPLEEHNRAIVELERLLREESALSAPNRHRLIAEIVSDFFGGRVTAERVSETVKKARQRARRAAQKRAKTGEPLPQGVVLTSAEALLSGRTLTQTALPRNEVQQLLDLGLLAGVRAFFPPWIDARPGGTT